MKETSIPTMPEEVSANQAGDGLSAAIVNHIEDGIEDSKTLREWRPWIAGTLLVVAGAFYGALFAVIFCDKLVLLAECAPVVAVAVLAAFSIIPTLIIVMVARAVFGKRSSADTPYAPLQAIIHLMKEMKC